MKFKLSILQMQLGMSLRILLCLVVTSIAVTGCGKSVQLQDISQSGVTSSPPVVVQGAGNSVCPASQVVRWSFSQPNQVLKNSVDILFVLDSSSSMDNKISRISAAVPTFLASLSPGLDYQVGVMLAHGGQSCNSGKLVAARGEPKVLSSKTETVAQIQSQLQKTLESGVEDDRGSNGDALLYSLNQSLVEPQLSQTKSLGFYRPDAALSVVLISDKNDLCYPPNLYGYSVFPDLVASLVALQTAAYQKVCLQQDGVTPKMTPDFTYSALKAFKGNEPLLLDAIVHRDPAKVPMTNQEAIGHGILELVQKDPQNQIQDISNLDYSSGLVLGGQRASRSLQLQTQFYLDGRFQIIPGSLMTSVAGRSVSFQFNSSTRTVSIAAQDAGQSQSVVEVTACKTAP